MADGVVEESEGNGQVLQGVAWLRRLRPLLKRLHLSNCQRDTADHRELYFDHLCGLVLLTFFNPTLVSLRNLKNASRLKQVKRKLGCREASLGSLSEAMHLFDAERLVEIIQELLGRSIRG